MQILIHRESVMLPKIVMDSLIITHVIDAVVLRDVVTLDISGACLYTDIDKEVIMVLRSELAELIAKVEPQLYMPYVVTTSRGESILYVKT